MKKSVKRVGKRLTRIVLTLIALGLFLVAGIGITSILASIAFGGLFRRIGGYETITGGIIAIGIGVSLLRARPKLENQTSSEKGVESGKSRD